MIPEDKYKTKAQTTRTPTKQRARTDFMVITFICTVRYSYSKLLQSEHCIYCQESFDWKFYDYEFNNHSHKFHDLICRVHRVFMCY
jgi:hypothetical protein